MGAFGIEGEQAGSRQCIQVQRAPTAGQDGAQSTGSLIAWCAPDCVQVAGDDNRDGASVVRGTTKARQQSMHQRRGQV